MKNKLTKKELAQLFSSSNFVHFNKSDVAIYRAHDEYADVYDPKSEEGFILEYDFLIRCNPDDLAFYKMQKVYPNEEEK